MTHNLLWTAALGLGLTACSVVPGSGPRTAAIEQANPDFALVDLTPETTRTIADFAAAHGMEAPIVLPPARQVGLIGPGDLLRVAIWEPNPNGTSLNADRSGLETVTRVGIDGTIGVPYAGRMQAAGRTPAQLERAVGDRLAHESPGAQVVVLVTDDLTNDVIVQGEVAKPGRYPVVPHSSGLLDILAMAGGAHTPERQTMVRITRGDTSVTRTLSHLVETRAMELDLAPGDRILVQPRQSYFYAFGAVNRPGEQAYNDEDPSLAHTLARIEGLADNRADPAAVFVYRRQSAELTRQLVPGNETSQTIYRLNLRDPAGFFVSERFAVVPGDLLYVSESPIVEAAKVVGIFTGLANVGAVPLSAGTQY